MTYMNPFKRGTRKSQRFSWNPSNGVNPVGGHTGDDWAVNVGTPVHAAADGIIRHSSWLTENYLDNDWWLTQMGGDTLVLDAQDANGNSYNLPTFVYAHLLDSTAPVGARVKKGQVIGLSGNSGTATTGPHCHAEVLPPNWDWNNGTYGRVDPELWFDEWPDDMTIQLQSAVKAKPKLIKESEMPTARRVSGTHKPHRLPKGGEYRLSARDDGANQNFAVNGTGRYNINLHVWGTDLPVGEYIRVTYEILTQGRASRYFSKKVLGSTDGTFEDHVILDHTVLPGTIIQVVAVSSKESAYLAGFGADVTTWKG